MKTVFLSKFVLKLFFKKNKNFVKILKSKKLLNCTRKDPHQMRHINHQLYKVFITLCYFFKKYNINNEDNKKIEYKPDYFFTDMTNINDFDPKLLLINETTTFKSGSTMFEISYCEENNVPYIVFNNIECIFRKSGINKYLVIYETKKNEKVLKN